MFGEKYYGFRIEGKDERGWVSERYGVQLLDQFEWKHFFEVLKDATRSGYCDVKELIKKIEQVKGNKQDNLLDTDEIKRAVNDPVTAKYLRRLVINESAEWSQITDQQTRKYHRYCGDPWYLHFSWVKKYIFEAFKDFQFWDEVKPKGLNPASLYFFHTVAFIEHLGRLSVQVINLEMIKAAGAVVIDSELEELIKIINQSADLYEINTPLRIAHFLSQVGHESGFKVIHERLNYSKEQMQATFTAKKSDGTYKYHKLWDEPDSYAHKPKEIANYVYANRMGNGDEASGDGNKYRGRGLIQLTGKDNYIAFTKNHNKRFAADKKDFENDPDLLINIDKYGIESAFSWWIENDVNSLCSGKSDKDVENVTQRVNGGQKGYDDRLKRFKAIITIIGH